MVPRNSEWKRIHSASHSLWAQTWYNYNIKEWLEGVQLSKLPKAYLGVFINSWGVAAGRPIITPRHKLTNFRIHRGLGQMIRAYITLRTIQTTCNLAITFVPKLHTTAWVRSTATNTPLFGSNIPLDRKMKRYWWINLLCLRCCGSERKARADRDCCHDLNSTSPIYRRHSSDIRNSVRVYQK